MPNIKSSTDLRNNYNAISRLCHESREPVFITRNGQGDLAVMSIAVYEAIISNLSTAFEDSKGELYRLLSVGRTDVLTGRTRSHTDVIDEMEYDPVTGVMRSDSSIPKMTMKEALGCMRGKFKIADDFDAPLEDFKEYME